MRSITLPGLRRLVVSAQGYAGRTRRGTVRDVERTIRRLSCVQLDSISTVERSHRIAIGTRVGSFPSDAVDRLLAEGRVFEYWAHEACLLPVGDYDLTERVIPRAVLEAPVPKEAETLRALALRAVRGRGALTEAGIVEHWRLRGGALRIRPHVNALADEGLLERIRVADGGAPVLVAAGTELDQPRPSTAVLLSPFDNLLWDRPFARRVLGFDHLIEVYKPELQRRYGYYMLPLCWRDRIVGRADLKSDRARGALVVKAFHREDGVRRSAALDTAFDRALDRLRSLAGLETVER